jgi:GTPase SAR1 family protein
MANRVDAKVVLLGANYSGKSCLMERYLHDKYHYDDPIPAVSNSMLSPKEGWVGLATPGEFDIFNAH